MCRILYRIVLIISELQSIRELQKRVFIEKESSPSLSQDIDQLRFSEEYQGAENRIISIIHYKVSLQVQKKEREREIICYEAEFSCTFANIADYPFGEETCLIVFFLKGIDNTLVSLNLSRFSDLGPSEVGQFVIKEWVERKETGDDDSNMREMKCYISILSFSLFYSSEASAWRFTSS